jgi:hypothetical protein
MVNNMRRIQRELDLKFKDFVFVDDRVEQREMVGSALPDIHVLDATTERSWRLLDRWASLLPSQPKADRAQLFRERTPGARAPGVGRRRGGHGAVVT